MSLETNHMSCKTDQMGFKILNRQTHNNFDQETNQISPETNGLWSPETYHLHVETNHLYRERYDLSPEPYQRCCRRATVRGASM
jgi:hypothetical protein